MQGTGLQVRGCGWSKGWKKADLEKLKRSEGDRTLGRIWSRGGVIGSVVTPDAAAAEQEVGRQGSGLEVSTRNPRER